VLVGSRADVPVAQAIYAALAVNPLNPLNPLNLMSTDLPTLAAILANCRALVSNDSGAMHLGAALGVPVTAVFGPTDERLTGPRPLAREVDAPGDSARRSDARSPTVAVLTHAVWCRPCQLRTCPIDHRCMRGVQTDAVLDAVRRRG